MLHKNNTFYHAVAFVFGFGLTFTLLGASVGLVTCQKIAILVLAGTVLPGIYISRGPRHRKEGNGLLWVTEV